MGVTKCVLFFKLFSSRRVCRTYPHPVDNLSHLWITRVRQIGSFVSVLIAFKFICATVQVGGRLIRSLRECALNKAPRTIPVTRDSSLYFLHAGLYPSDMPFPFTPRKQSHNLQISEVIDAIAQADPDLFDNDNATLMPVEYRDKLNIVICDAHLNNLTPYDAPAPAPETATTAIVGRMNHIARWHGALQANFERELFGAPLALSLA